MSLANISMFLTKALRNSLLLRSFNQLIKMRRMSSNLIRMGACTFLIQSHGIAIINAYKAATKMISNAMYNKKYNFFVNY